MGDDRETFFTIKSELLVLVVQNVDLRKIKFAHVHLRRKGEFYIPNITTLALIAPEVIRKYIKIPQMYPFLPIGVHPSPLVLQIIFN